MIDAALRAVAQIFAPEFRAVLWRSLGITLALLILVWFSLEGLLQLFVTVPYPWLDTLIAILAGLGLFIGLIFLLGPITSLVAGLFVDEIAAHVERRDYPEDAPGRELPVARSLIMSAKFAALVVAVNLVALMLLLVPGINAIAFLGANGYLLGREFFELAAMRHMSVEEARALRRANRLRVFTGGLLIAGLVAIPLANLFTPLFATAFMVHVFKKVQGRSAPSPMGHG